MCTVLKNRPASSLPTSILALMVIDVRSSRRRMELHWDRRFLKRRPKGKITTISYNFPKPGATEPSPKEAYVTAVGNEGCGVGYYK